MTPPLLFGGIGALLALAFAASSPGRQALTRAAETGMDLIEPWIDRVIARVAAHEGGFDSLNLNLDGAGLSFGLLQWAQAPGALGVLLAAMHQADPTRFAATFGPAWSELLAVTSRGALAPVEGALLWVEPWVSRFRAAGRDPVFVDVQRRVAREGAHFQGAIEAARLLGVTTERSLALLFDTSVQQGPAFTKRLAAKVRAQLEGERPSATDAELLTTFAQLAPAHFRRTTPPTEPYPARHIAWRQTGDEWHAWAGRFDLYAGVLRRRTGILRDPTLSDEAVQLPTNQERMT